LIQSGKHEQAIVNFKTLTNQFIDDTATVKHALFGLWNLYFHELQNAEKAKEYLDELKTRFPEDQLTLQAKLLMGEVDSAAINKIFILKDENKKVAAIPVPEKYGLQTNYPNPFNPSTTISYQLPAISMVRLCVYDMLGREVVTLVNGMKEAGCYNATFNAAQLASGVYFVRFTAQPQDGGKQIVQTRKMLMTK
jgi:hypothetical protein